MKARGTILRWIGIIGICCSSLCFLALPLLLILLPTSGFGWIHSETLTRSMLLMFLAMFLTGSVSSFRMHGRWGPFVAALLGAVVLAATAWHALPPQAGWAGLAALAATWAYDRKLMWNHHHHQQQGHGPG